eukprot:scaffold6405_cov390-Prasinococcus_capsulatus_cf.AAC.2
MRCHPETFSAGPMHGHCPMACWEFRLSPANAGGKGRKEAHITYQVQGVGGQIEGTVLGKRALHQRHEVVPWVVRDD